MSRPGELAQPGGRGQGRCQRARQGEGARGGGEVNDEHVLAQAKAEGFHRIGKPEKGAYTVMQAQRRYLPVMAHGWVRAGNVPGFVERLTRPPELFRSPSRGGASHYART